jgi:hypothetical protein
MDASGFTLCALGGELASFGNFSGRTIDSADAHRERRRRHPLLRTRAILIDGAWVSSRLQGRSTAGGYILNRRQFVKATALAAGAPLLAALPAGLSPNGSVLVNSYCHAWSCTPAYLPRSLNPAGK